MILAFMVAIIFSSFSSAHASDIEISEKSFFDFKDPVFYIIMTSILIIIITIVLLIVDQNFAEHYKKIIFGLIVFPVILSTLFLAGNTIYENVISETGGPVHWHADYQVWACGERLNLIDPNFPRNKIGTPLLHEHNDDRVHVEGTPKKIEDVSFQNYFKVIGGELSSYKLSYPIEEGLKTYNSGDSCPDGTIGRLNVYVNGQRLEDFESYVPYPDSLVPPGDCVIVEFSPGNSQTTEKICESWKANNWNYDNYQRREITIGSHTWK